MGRLDERVALVTGASRGIGLATARRFAEEGAKVCIMDIDGDAVEEAGQELRDDGLEVFALEGDVSDPDDAKRIVGATVERYDRLDILVNNAGVIRDNLLYKMTVDDWDTVMQVHLRGTFLFSKEAQKQMVEQEYGRILAVSSTSALGNRGQANYSTAKAGIQGFVKTLAIELGKYGITANAVAPGFIETAMTRATAERIGVDFDDFKEARAEATPVQRTGKPEDVAAALLYFASEEAGFVTGQVLYVAGGPRN
ncbi:MAG: 3-oxoacyl-ACP reductase FabG [Longimicrobiales bacterium]|nr:3-oxoacyl-ACP reductase FabG [Longimicrobiales bacterium]